MDLWRRSIPTSSQYKAQSVYMTQRAPTLLPQAHLYLQGLEITGDACLDLPAHSLPCPLLETTELLIDIHDDDQ